jgi:hypothetical protein
MKSSVCSAILISIALGSVATPSSAGDVQVGVTIAGEITPGVYGRVDLSNRPPPPLLYATPVVIERSSRVGLEPIYLHVPPGHAKNWSKHCREYQACNRPVYFVKSAEYEPGYKPDDHGKGRGKHDQHHGNARH